VTSAELGIRAQRGHLRICPSSVALLTKNRESVAPLTSARVTTGALEEGVDIGRELHRRSIQ
jgi:hypothetical protein